MREIVSPLDGFLSPFGRISGSGADAYAIGGASPELVAAFLTAADGTTEGEYFRTGGAVDDFSMFTFSRSGTATYFDSNGTLQTAADGVARRNAYYYSGSAWAKGGLLLESAAATQLLHGTDSFATQTETVTAQAYTLQFQGTGSIALTGAHTATLNGTGANDLVSLTFTPSAGTLTLTPSGTVDYPQLEVGSIPTSYIPNTAGSGTVTRAAETLSVASGDWPYSAAAMSIYAKVLFTSSAASATSSFYRAFADADNYIRVDVLSSLSRMEFFQEASNVRDSVLITSAFTPGINVPIEIAARHGATFINGAVGGTATTANETPTALPDLSSAALALGINFNGFISELRMWGTDIGDSGIEEVTS